MLFNFLCNYKNFIDNKNLNKNIKSFIQIILLRIQNFILNYLLFADTSVINLFRNYFHAHT